MSNEELKLEAIAREVRRLTLGYAAMHFDGKDHMIAPSYVAEYLRSLNDAPIDVSGLLTTQPAEQASAASIGDDPEFVQMLFAWRTVEQARNEFAAIIAYIDSRPRQAEQASAMRLHDSFVSTLNAMASLPLQRTEAIVSLLMVHVERSGHQARDAALEDAATECEREKWYAGARQASQAHDNVWDAAKAIRTLKSSAPKLADGEGE